MTNGEELVADPESGAPNPLARPRRRARPPAILEPPATINNQLILRATPFAASPFLGLRRCSCQLHGPVLPFK